MKIPRDVNGSAVQLTQNTVALQVTKNDSVTTASLVAVTLNAATSLIRVVSLDNGIFLRYQATGVTSTVFDEYVPAFSVIDLVVPDGCTAISFIADEGTARVRVIEK